MERNKENERRGRKRGEERECVGIDDSEVIHLNPIKIYFI